MRKHTIIRIMTIVVLLMHYVLTIAQVVAWEDAASMPTQRGFATAAVVNGKVYVIGGSLSPTQATDVMEVYDPATGNWDTTKARLPVALSAAASVVVDNKIYVLGGKTGLNLGTYVNTVYEYDPEMDAWRLEGYLPFARAHLAACELAGRIYAIGGRTISAFSINTVDRYDPYNNVWAAGTDVRELHTVRSNLSAHVVNGHIYVLGGLTGTGIEPLKVEIFNPATNTWIESGSIPEERYLHGFGTHNGHIYLFGGISGIEALTNMIEYIPQTSLFENKGDLPVPVKVACASAVVDGFIYGFGGILEPYFLPNLPGPSVTASVIKGNLVSALNPEGQEAALVLAQNEPNPFYSQTNILYELKEPGWVTLRVLDMNGCEIARLVNDYQGAGAYTATWHAGSAPTGVYLYQLTTNQYSMTKKCVLQY